MSTQNSSALSRRNLLTLISSAAIPALSMAQTAWPSKPIKLVVPFAAGQSIDAVARMLAEQLGRALGQTVIVDNKPGAAGIIGTGEVARSAPDGYTLILTPTSVMTINPYIYPKAQHPYDVQKDFVPISHTTSVPFALVTGTAQPYKNFSEFMAFVKAKPGIVDYASLGPGSQPHVMVEMLKNMTGTNMVHIPYKSLYLTDVMSGIVAVAFEPLTTAVPQIRAGKLRALAIGSSKRSPALPDVPTIAESVPGYEGDAWHGVLAPAGTPKDIVTRINTELAKIMRMPEIQARMTDLGLVSVGGTVQEFEALVKKDSTKWATVIRDNKITLESS